MPSCIRLKKLMNKKPGGKNHPGFYVLTFYQRLFTYKIVAELNTEFWVKVEVIVWPFTVAVELTFMSCLISPTLGAKYLRPVPVNGTLIPCIVSVPVKVIRVTATFVNEPNGTVNKLKGSASKVALIDPVTLPTSESTNEID